LRVSLEPEGRVLLGDRDVTAAIRSERVSANVSQVSAHPEVRTSMLSLQRKSAEAADLVCEGRDMGTVVFPDADLKVYLDADVGVRAERRRAELLNAGEDLSREQLVARLKERDRRDSTRDHAPLQRTASQMFVDTSDMTIDEVVEHLAKLVSARRK
jgi:cytidylate kinase